MRKLPLNDYEIQYDKKFDRILTQAKGQLFSDFIDIVKSVAAIFVHPNNVDYSALEKFKDGALIFSFCPEGTEERFFLLNIHATVPDSAEFIGPLEAQRINISSVDIERKRIGSIFVQCLGIIDKPLTTDLSHHPKTSMVTPNGTAESQCAGVLSLTRDIHMEDDNTMVVSFTHLVGTDATMAVELWSSVFVLTKERDILNAKDVKIYIEPLQSTTDTLKLGLS